MSAAAREALADERYRRFAKAFEPEGVFERAGVYDMLEQRARDYPNRPAAPGSDATSSLVRPHACFLSGEYGVTMGKEQFAPYVDLASAVD